MTRKNVFFLIPAFLCCSTISAALSLATATCTTSSDCGSNGVCATTGKCTCSRGYVTTKTTEPCAYEQKSKLTAFILSFLAGALGADWFYLSAGSGGYIAAGALKFLTGGGFGLWALVDWIRIITDTFPDGQGVALRDWN